MEPRVMFFIDVGQTRAEAENEGRALDYEALVEELADGRYVVNVCAFDACSGSQRPNHLRNLESLGYMVFARRLVNDVQKGVDVELACEMLSHAFRGSYDVAILVSGDADFIPVVKRVRDLGKQVEVASFSNACSQEMRCAGNRFVDLDGVPVFKEAE